MILLNEEILKKGLEGFSSGTKRIMFEEIEGKVGNSEEQAFAYKTLENLIGDLIGEFEDLGNQSVLEDYGYGDDYELD